MNLRPSALPLRFTVLTAVTPKSFCDLISGPFTSKISFRTREVPVFEFEIDWQRLCLVAINQIQNESAVVPRGRTIEIGDLIESAIGSI